MTFDKKIITGALVTSMMSFTLQAYAQTDTVQTALGSASNFGDFVSLVWNYGSQILIVLAVFFIVLGAFFIVSTGGNEERAGQGKQMVIGSLVSVLIVIFSGVLIRTLHQPAAGTTGTLADVPRVIQNATSILVGSIGAFTVAMVIYAAYLYLTAGGDTGKLSKANSSLRYAFMGLILGVLAYAVVNGVVNYFI